MSFLGITAILDGCKHGDAWMVLNGRVLCVFGFMSQHPGGESKTLTVVGEDDTAEYKMMHCPGVKTNASQISLHAHTVLLELKKTQCSRVRNQLGETRRHHTWKLHGETHRAKTVNTHEALVLISEFKENQNSRQTMKHRKKGFFHKNG